MKIKSDEWWQAINNWSKNDHSFEEWYQLIGEHCKALGSGVWLIGGPSEEEDDIPEPMSDSEVNDYLNNNRDFYLNYYNKGETPSFTMVESVL